MGGTLVALRMGKNGPGSMRVGHGAGGGVRSPGPEAPAGRAGGGRCDLRFDLGFDELGCHQANLMAELQQLSGPEVRAPAGLHANQARRHLHQEAEDLLAPPLIAES